MNLGADCTQNAPERSKRKRVLVHNSGDLRQAATPPLFAKPSQSRQMPTAFLTLINLSPSPQLPKLPLGELELGPYLHDSLLLEHLLDSCRSLRFFLRHPVPLHPQVHSNQDPALRPKALHSDLTIQQPQNQLSFRGSGQARCHNVQPSSLLHRLRSVPLSSRQTGQAVETEPVLCTAFNRPMDRLLRPIPHFLGIRLLTRM